MMEDKLNRDLSGHSDALGFALPMSALDNCLFLGGLEDTVDNNNTQQQHPQVHGKCKEGTQLAICSRRYGISNFLHRTQMEKRGPEIQLNVYLQEIDKDWFGLCFIFISTRLSNWQIK